MSRNLRIAARSRFVPLSKCARTLFLTACFGAAQALSASADITPFQASYAVQEGITDPEVYLLNVAVGATGTFGYESSNTDLGWSGQLFSTTPGQQTSLSYSGDLTNLDNGLITWSVSGTSNNQSVSGTGSAQFTPTANGYRIDIASDLDIGGLPYSHAGFADAMWNGDLLDSGESQASVTIPFTPNTPGYGYFWERTRDGGRRNGWRCGNIYIVTSGNGHFSTGDGWGMQQELIVPEPSSIALVTLGALGMLWRRR